MVLFPIAREHPHDLEPNEWPRGTLYGLRLPDANSQSMQARQLMTSNSAAAASYDAPRWNVNSNILTCNRPKAQMGEYEIGTSVAAAAFGVLKYPPLRAGPAMPALTRSTRAEIAEKRGTPTKPAEIRFQNIWLCV